MTYSCTVILASLFSRIKLFYKVQLALLFQVKDLRYLSFLKTGTIFSHFVDCEFSSFSVIFSRPLLSMRFEGLEEGIGVVFVYMYVGFLFHFLVLCIYVSICCYWKILEKDLTIWGVFWRPRGLRGPYMECHA